MVKPTIVILKDEIIRQDRPFFRELNEDEEFIVISPFEMTFLFEMGPGECHQKLTGACSLERRQPDRSHDIGDECDYDVCPNLLKSMRKIGLHSMMQIDIIKCRCGHYEFNDGQHRICIAQRKGIKIEALVTTVDNVCEMCQGRADAEAELR